MTREEAVAELQKLQDGGDTEAAHADADRVLCKMLRALGYDDIVEEWLNVPKWYA